LSGYKAIPPSSLGVAGGTAVGILVGSYTLAWLLGLSPPGGYFVLLGIVATAVALAVDNTEKARPVKEAVLGGAAFASLSSLLSLWAVPYFLPSWEELVGLHAAPLVYALQFFSAWVLFTVVYAGLDYYSEA
jgi:hypothetical protein